MCLAKADSRIRLLEFALLPGSDHRATSAVNTLGSPGHGPSVRDRDGSA